MGKVFRKIRFKVLFKNRLGRYLLYAIGEIALVVVGILIALNLSNWNDQKKAKAKVELVFEDITEELISDIDNLNVNVIFYLKVFNTTDLVLSDKPSLENYHEITNLLMTNGNTQRLSLTQYGFDILTQDVNNIPFKFKPTLKSLSILYDDHKKKLEYIDNQMHDFFLENSNVAMQNYSWFSEKNESKKQDQIEFMLKDYRYKNKIKRLQDILNQWLLNIFIYRNRAIMCYNRITELLNKPLDDKKHYFDKNIAKLLVGDWQEVGNPEKIGSFFFHKNRLLFKFSKVSEIYYDVICYGQNEVFVFLKNLRGTIVKENNKTFLKFNSSIDFKKIE